MRILHILSEVPDLGNGIVNAAIDLAAGQAEQGHTVVIASAGGGHEPLLRRLGIRHLPLDQTHRPMQLMKAVFTLRRYFREFEPDIVHTHVITGLLLGWFLTRFTGHPLVAHVQNVHERKFAMMRLADRVVVCSEAVGKTMQEMGVPEAKIRVVHNAPLQSPRLPALSSVPPASIEHPAIVTVCGMNHRKGVADLISAFEQVAQEVPVAHLYLVGDGPEMSLFQQQADATDCRNRIHFEGFHNSPQSYMQAADIFVLASRREAFGLVLVEARQVGCAIIASEVDGIPEALDYGAAGILFPPSDVPALTRHLVCLLTDDLERKAWQQKALSGAERFHYATMASGVSDVYRELLLRDPWFMYVQARRRRARISQSSN
jgi:glycosyltransferase involved in cell wall biosynthesis